MDLFDKHDQANHLADLEAKRAASEAPPFVRDSETSRDAAESMTDHVGGLRKQILDVIKASPTGLTCDECEALLGMRHQTASARVRELRGLELIVDSGEKRKTRSGRNAVVWVSKRTTK